MHAPKTIKAQATREALLAAAQAILIECQGELEIKAVYDRCDCSPGLIYRYFGSRDGLVAAVVDAFYQRYDDYVMASNPAPGQPWKVREYQRLQKGVAFFYHDPAAKVILVQLKRELPVAAVEAERIEAHLAMAADNIRHGQQRGELDSGIDPEIVGAMILGGMRQAVGAALQKGNPPRQQALVDQLWRFILAGVTLAVTED